MFIRAIKPLQLAYGLPKFALRIFFGKTNRPSKTYDDLVAKYKTKLAAGGKASGPFIPPFIGFEKKDALIKKYDEQKRKYDEQQKEQQAIREAERSIACTKMCINLRMNICPQCSADRQYEICSDKCSK